ncbi:MAG: hypothetical protein OHK0045_18740 [Raineya sp.]
MNDRDKILEAIQKALLKSTEKKVPQPDFTTPIYVPANTKDLAIIFAENLKAIQGDFCFCEDEKEFLLNLLALINYKKTKNVFVWEKELQDILDLTDIAYKKDDEGFKAADIGITTCEMLVARDGGILVSSRQKAGRRLTIFPHVHVVVAFTSQLVYDVETALQKMRERYRQMPSMLSFINGPSRTADIEKTLVLGAHGPKELHVFLIENQVHTL